jgi:hypothetical protein
MYSKMQGRGASAETACAGCDPVSSMTRPRRSRCRGRIAAPMMSSAQVSDAGWAAVELAEHQRADAERVAAPISFLLVEADQR